MQTYWKILSLTVLVSLSLLACSNDQDKHQTELITSVQTDQSHYSPGSKVTFNAAFKQSTNGKLTVTYKHLDETVDSKIIHVNGKKQSWTWTPPKTNGKGYLATITYEAGDAFDQETIAVDVSEDWTQFPRYGYVTDFSQQSEEEISTMLNKLNRYHLNGLQFYNWMYKHHQPIKGEANDLPKEWKNIADKSVSVHTLQGYTQAAKERNMTSMANNLLYGAESQAKNQGIQIRWRLYANPAKTDYAHHSLPDGSRSDIYILNPFHEGWQDYHIQKQHEAITALGFDGWHVDQLGDLSPVYNYAGTKLLLSPSFEPFLKKAKAETDKELVMNAVNQYGQESISNAPVNFLYSELSKSRTHYRDLKQVIEENDELSYHQLQTVLATSQNLIYTEQTDSADAPSTLLKNSVIFASGGAQLEIGDQLLGADDKLEKTLITYYDFLTAYQNLLRDKVKESELTINKPEKSLLAKEPQKGKVWAFAKQKDNKKLLHLINFTDAKHMNWHDPNGEQPEPKLKNDLTVSLQETLDVKKIWYASPDQDGGAPKQLSFTQKDNTLEFTVPHLKYWDMVVVEYK